MVSRAARCPPACGRKGRAGPCCRRISRCSCTSRRRPGHVLDVLGVRDARRQPIAVHHDADALPGEGVPHRAVHAEEVAVAEDPGPAVNEDQHGKILLSLRQVQVEPVLVLVLIGAVVVDKVLDRLDLVRRHGFLRCRGRGGEQEPAQENSADHAASQRCVVHLRPRQEKDRPHCRSSSIILRDSPPGSTAACRFIRTRQGRSSAKTANRPFSLLPELLWNGPGGVSQWSGACSCWCCFWWADVRRPPRTASRNSPRTACCCIGAAPTNMPATVSAPRWRSEPTDPVLLYNLAQCHDRLGEKPEAERLYNECLGHAPDHAEARHALLVLMIDTGRQPAGANGSRLVARRPGLSGPYVEEGWLCARDGDLHGAAQCDTSAPSTWTRAARGRWSSWLTSSSASAGASAPPSSTSAPGRQPRSARGAKPSTRSAERRQQAPSRLTSFPSFLKLSRIFCCPSRSGQDKILLQCPPEVGNTASRGAWRSRKAACLEGKAAREEKYGAHLSSCVTIHLGKEPHPGLPGRLADHGGLHPLLACRPGGRLRQSLLRRRDGLAAAGDRSGAADQPVAARNVGFRRVVPACIWSDQPLRRRRRPRDAARRGREMGFSSIIHHRPRPASGAVSEEG